ncbi:MAG TPA: TolC family protein [Usitatibacter sp.]|nr:TolC family protein [Usitatibacter sp.]
MKWQPIAALLAACIASAAIAAGNPLTLAEAQRLALERTRQIAAQDSAISASRHMAVAAGQLPDPTLKAGIDNLPVTGPDRFSLSADFMTMKRIGVMQELTGSDKRELRSRRYELEAEKSEVERDAVIAAIQRDTALAWLDRYYAESMAGVVDAQIREARLEIEGTESAYRAARGSQADVFAAQGALAVLEDRAAEYRRRVTNAKIALARWIGDDARRPLASRPSFETTHGHHMPAAVASHPMIAMLSKQEEIASTQAKLATADRKPDWSVELMYANRGSAFSDMVSVGVSVPLPWDRANRQDQEVAAKLAMADEARARRDDALQAHVAEVEAMANEWDDDRLRLERYRTEIVPLARSRSEGALAAYRGARSSLMDVLSARRAEIDVRMQALQLEMEIGRLWAQLNFLVPDEALLPARLSRGLEDRK